MFMSGWNISLLLVLSLCVSSMYLLGVMMVNIGLIFRLLIDLIGG